MGSREAITPRRATVNRDGRSVHAPAVNIRVALPRGGFALRLILLGFLVCSAIPALWASSPARQPDNATVHQSSGRAARPQPPRLSISPNGATLSANQTQHFAVTGADGKPVSVHWDVSGLSCSGSACGTIDDDGTYRAPHFVSRSLAVIVEGVLVSDPKHSVLTQIQLTPAPVVVPAPAAAPAAAPVAVQFSTRAPLVSYQGGQLTIDAENSTLAAVLQLVAEKTGAVIDIPPGSGLDPIVEHAGPGPANDVLTQLLNGSRFNFIIVNSPQYPDEPVQVLLSVKRASPEAPNAIPVPQPALASAAEVTPADPDAVPVGIESPPANAATASKEQLPPDVIEQMMKDRARQIRENAQQQQQAQQ
jgi:hypothetical protein